MFTTSSLTWEMQFTAVCVTAPYIYNLTKYGTYQVYEITSRHDIVTANVSSA